MALGVRFDDRTSSSGSQATFTIPPTKVIHVDIDPEEIGRNYPVVLGLLLMFGRFAKFYELDRRVTPQNQLRTAKNGLQ